MSEKVELLASEIQSYLIDLSADRLARMEELTKKINLARANGNFHFEPQDNMIKHIAERRNFMIEHRLIADILIDVISICCTVVDI